jgi:hypothetical protein
MSACTSDQMGPLVSACASMGSTDVTSGAACGTPCEDAARKMAADAGVSCVAAGDVQDLIDSLVATCDGLTAVGGGGGRGGRGGGGAGVTVGLRERCAIGFCEDGNCPVCASGLQV